jgi:hypothetical protein
MADSCSECGPPMTVTFMPELYFFFGNGAGDCAGARCCCIFLGGCAALDGFGAGSSVVGVVEDGEVDVEEALDDDDEADDDVENFVVMVSCGNEVSIGASVIGDFVGISLRTLMTEATESLSDSDCTGFVLVVARLSSFVSTGFLLYSSSSLSQSDSSSYCGRDVGCGWTWTPFSIHRSTTITRRSSAVVEGHMTFFFVELD